jgi:hypothetical protein
MQQRALHMSGQANNEQLQQACAYIGQWSTWSAAGGGSRGAGQQLRASQHSSDSRSASAMHELHTLIQRREERVQTLSNGRHQHAAAAETS